MAMNAVLLHISYEYYDSRRAWQLLELTRFQDPSKTVYSSANHIAVGGTSRLNRRLSRPTPVRRMNSSA